MLLLTYGDSVGVQIDDNIRNGEKWLQLDARDRGVGEAHRVADTAGVQPTVGTALSCSHLS
jgi:hypothetical protein